MVFPYNRKQINISVLSHVQRVPKKYAESFEGSVSENIELEGPTGTTWPAKMIRSDGTFLLQSGWKEFLAANKIDKNDILVFTYNGISSFKVLIFDPSGCEKAAPFFATKMEVESDDSSIRVGVAPHHDAKKEIISLSTGTSTGTDPESSSEVPSHSARTGMTGGKPSSKRKQRGTCFHMLFELFDLIYTTAGVLCGQGL
jgi:B3 DNA binding domain